jgi:hypothetical protein
MTTICFHASHLLVYRVVPAHCLPVAQGRKMCTCAIFNATGIAKSSSSSATRTDETIWNEERRATVWLVHFDLTPDIFSVVELCTGSWVLK